MRPLPAARRPWCLVHLTSSRNLSGGTRQALLLAEALRERGHRLLFCAPPDAPALELGAGRGLEVRPVAVGGLRQQWRASRQLRQIVAECGAQVVHTHHTNAHNVALLATFGGSFPPVVANRGVLFKPKFPAKFRSPRTAALITNSGRVRAVLRAVGVPGEKVHVVYNAVQIPAGEDLGSRVRALRREVGLEGAGPVVGCVGSGRPEKGFQFLVEAAPAILQRFPEAFFTLVGADTGRLRPRIERLGLSGRFLLPGYRTDATDWMGLFDCFVLPSIDMESCPNVLLEAMAVGVPAVGADVGGVAEILADGETGRVVPPGDPAALGAAVTGILGDPEAAGAMARVAQQRAAAVFTAAAKAEGTLRVYAEVLGR